MSKIRRIGLRRDPQGGWPLDRLLVGVATLRTIRELFRAERKTTLGPVRAWDISLRSGVTPQGTADALERLRQAGLVTVMPPDRPGRARRFVLDRTHPLCEPLESLFEAEIVASRNATLKPTRAVQ